MLRDNILAKIDWAEIAGDCIISGQELGFKRAMIEYNAYEARDVATQWATVQRALNRFAPIAWKTSCQELTVAYREMVKANNKKASKGL